MSTSFWLNFEYLLLANLTKSIFKFRSLRIAEASCLDFISYARVIDKPPSTKEAVPVTKDESSEAK
jgi:hypothetical protein